MFSSKAGLRPLPGSGRSLTHSLTHALNNPLQQQRCKLQADCCLSHYLIPSTHSLTHSFTQLHVHHAPHSLPHSLTHPSHTPSTPFNHYTHSHTHSLTPYSCYPIYCGSAPVATLLVHQWRVRHSHGWQDLRCVQSFQWGSAGLRARHECTGE